MLSKTVHHTYYPTLELNITVKTLTYIAYSKNEDEKEKIQIMTKIDYFFSINISLTSNHNKIRINNLKVHTKNRKLKRSTKLYETSILNALQLI